MGVINLSILVEKLRKKLSGDFVKKTDYATKTKFGVVKIGDGISVNGGKISVESSGGSVTLYHYTEGSQAVNTDINFSTPLPTGTKYVVFTSQGSSYPWITGFGIVNPNMTVPAEATGWTTQMVGYTGAPTVLVARDGTKFQRTSGSSEIVTDVIAIL